MSLQGCIIWFPRTSLCYFLFFFSENFLRYCWIQCVCARPPLDITQPLWSHVLRGATVMTNEIQTVYFLYRRRGGEVIGPSLLTSSPTCVCVCMSTHVPVIVEVLAALCMWLKVKWNDTPSQLWGSSPVLGRDFSMTQRFRDHRWSL